MSARRHRRSGRHTAPRSTTSARFVPRPPVELPAVVRSLVAELERTRLDPTVSVPEYRRMQDQLEALAATLPPDQHRELTAVVLEHAVHELLGAHAQHLGWIDTTPRHPERTRTP